MAGRVYLSMAYVAPRAALWMVLFIAALVDGIRHRAVRSRGFQLYWAMVGSAALFVLQDIVLLVLVGTSEGQVVNKATLGAYIFFANLAASYWFGILLLVAAGYCISRTNLGPHKNVVLAIPLVYFGTALVVDYVLYWLRGFDAFTDQTTYYDQIPEEAVEKVGGTTGLVYLICLLANTMSMLLAWFFIFDTIQKEKDILEQGHPDVSAIPGGAAGAGGEGPSRGGLPVPSAGVGGAVTGGNSVLLDDAGGNMSHMYIDVVEADLDAPKTFQDKVDDREKLTLVRRFFYGVCFYLLTTILVIFLPLFVPSVVDRTILVLQNAVLWLFLAALLWTFRMRQGSLYLMMDEDEGGMQAHETGGLAEATTELGVMSQRDYDHLNQGALRGGNRFTLSEEEEHHHHHHSGGGGGDGAGGSSNGGGGMAGQSSLNVHAAQQGVFVTALPTPTTPGPGAAAPDGPPFPTRR